MTVEILHPILAGRLALVVGIANEHSIAYGCAKAFREIGAEVAVTYLNEKARPYVEPLATGLDAPIVLPLDEDDEKAAFDESGAAVRELSQRFESCARNRQYEADDNRARMMTYADLPPQTITYSALTTRPM
jgi:enoyl-[acyl-carrier-protein] reductase (NADH)